MSPTQKVEHVRVDPPGGHVQRRRGSFPSTLLSSRRRTQDGADFFYLRIEPLLGSKMVLVWYSPPPADDYNPSRTNATWRQQTRSNASRAGGRHFASQNPNCMASGWRLVVGLWFVRTNGAQPPLDGHKHHQHRESGPHTAEHPTGAVPTFRPLTRMSAHSHEPVGPRCRGEEPVSAIRSVPK